MSLVKLLGDTLATKDGTVATKDALAGKKAVGLYFSAHWCPPCRGFTPKLAEIYKGLIASGKELEIVFVSSDRDEKAFDGYHAEQPWLALPYADRKTKALLSKKYKVQGIPSLVILDGETGDVITKDGRSAIMEDPEGKNFPWKPPTIWEALGDEFMTTDSDTVELAELRGEGKVLGLYFSAHWCPPCKSFTPALVETYKKLKADGKQVEFIFVSSDRDMGSFTGYFSEMPWLAIPPGDPRKAKLSSLFEVEGIPTLVFIDADTGATITTNGRGAVSRDPEGADFPWHPPALVDMSDDPSVLNEETCLCVLMEGVAPAARAELSAMLTPLAEKAKGAGEQVFLVAKEIDGVSNQVRKLCGLGEPIKEPQMIIMDIPDEGGFYVSDAKELNAESVAAFLSAFKAGSLERKQLKPP